MSKYLAEVDYIGDTKQEFKINPQYFKYFKMNHKLFKKININEYLQYNLFTAKLTCTVIISLILNKFNLRNHLINQK